MSTLLELVNEVLRRTGQREVTTLTSAKTPVLQAVDYLNETYTELLQRLKVDRLQKQATLETTNGTISYTLESDADINSLITDSVINTSSGNILTEVDYSYPLTHGEDTTANPTCFYGKDDKLYFYPIPDNTYTIQYDYFISPQDLSSDSETTALPESWEKALILGTQSRLEKFLGEPTANETFVIYRDTLAQLRAMALNKPYNRMQGNYKGYQL